MLSTSLNNTFPSFLRLSLDAIISFKHARCVVFVCVLLLLFVYYEVFRFVVLFCLCICLFIVIVVIVYLQYLVQLSEAKQ